MVSAPNDPLGQLLMCRTLSETNVQYIKVKLIPFPGGDIHPNGIAST